MGTTILGIESTRVRPIIYEAYKRGYITADLVRIAGYEPNKINPPENKRIIYIKFSNLLKSMILGEIKNVERVRGFIARSLLEMLFLHHPKV